MKKIIDGRLYNTDTAKLIGEFSSPGNWNDFSHYQEELFLKKSGEFFLHGEGGPATKYKEQAGTNCWSGGEKIIPLGYEDARDWCEKNLSVEEYEAVFGEIAEDCSKVRVNVSLAADVLEKAKRVASERGTSLSAMIDEFLKGLN